VNYTGIEPFQGDCILLIKLADKNPDQAGSAYSNRYRGTIRAWETWSKAQQ